MHRGVTVLVMCLCLCLSATKDVTTSVQEYYAQCFIWLLSRFPWAWKHTNELGTYGEQLWSFWNVPERQMESEQVTLTIFEQHPWMLRLYLPTLVSTTTTYNFYCIIYSCTPTITRIDFCARSCAVAHTQHSSTLTYLEHIRPLLLLCCVYVSVCICLLPHF